MLRFFHYFAFLQHQKKSTRCSSGRASVTKQVVASNPADAVNIGPAQW